MICKNLKTGKYFNYKFINDGELVVINDGQGVEQKISYNDWHKDYLTINKWKNLDEWDKKYNNELEK